MREMCANGRAYAERTFDIDQIADRFENVLLKTEESILLAE